MLSGPIQCKGQGGTAVELCYGTQPPVAQFAVCYNTNTLIPDFTGHIVSANIQGGGRDSNWRADQGNFGNTFECRYITNPRIRVPSELHPMRTLQKLIDIR